MSHTYPKNLNDAAEILDKDWPKWWEKINIKALHMDDTENCILGQLYDGYDNGMSLLFGINTTDNTHVYDRIFGSEARRADWKRIIELRNGVAEQNKNSLTTNERTKLIALILGQPAKLTDKQKLDLVVKLGNFT